MALTDNVSSAPSGACGEWEIWCHVKAWSYDLFRDFVELFADLFSWLFDQVLSLAITILGALPDLPVQSFDWGGLSFLFYFLDRLQIDVALGILGAGLVFRLTRKLFTLGQW